MLVAPLVLVVAINTPAAARCCTGEAGCQGTWTATADVFPLVCFRLERANGQDTQFCVQRGQRRPVQVQSGDTISWWAENAPVPKGHNRTPVCTD
jgi:hypothetical protein